MNTEHTLYNIGNMEMASRSKHFDLLGLPGMLNEYANMHFFPH